MFARAIDTREFLVIIRDYFSSFSSKPYIVTPLTLDETVQIRGYNIWFR